MNLNGMESLKMKKKKFFFLHFYKNIKFYFVINYLSILFFLVYNF